MATRRDYELVANALNIVFKERNVGSKIKHPEWDIAVEITATLADKFSLQNPRFDRQKFIQACWKGC